MLRTAKRLQKEGHDISYSRVYQIMKSNGLVIDSPVKSRKHRWVRYERLYSNAMWHTDWHVMKDPRMKDLNLIMHLMMSLYRRIKVRDHSSEKPGIGHLI